jgi:microcystin-dependent protein
MSEPFIGEIKMFGGNYAPQGWAFCDGSSLPISQNDALFSLIGTTYGGDGQQSFNLPDLRGRVPVHRGTLQGVTYQLGWNSGAEAVQLTPANLPAHTHGFPASTASANTGVPAPAMVPAAADQVTPYSISAAGGAMNAQSVQTVGGSQPHDNMMPFQVVAFIIALVGVWPPRN